MKIYKNYKNSKKKMDYKIGDRVSVSSNNVAVGIGVVDSVNYDGISISYTIRLDKPINYVECLTDDLELLYDGD